MRSSPRPPVARRRAAAARRPAPVPRAPRLLVHATAVLLLALGAVAALPEEPKAQAPGRSTEAAPPLPPLLVNDELGIRDRCTSCHVNLLDPSHGLDPQPRTSHPGHLLEIHSPLRFGCTPCHGGRGAATSEREAHAPGIDSVRYAGAAAEIACGRCHVGEDTLDGAPHLSHGRDLIRRAQCEGCHQLGETWRRDRPGPDLAGIADRVDAVWLFRWIQNPRDYADNARMPRFELEPKYVDALVGYLETFHSETSFDSTRFPAGDAKRGGSLVRGSFCISCHSIDGKGGTGAIDLGRVGSKLTRPRLLRILADTHGADPRTAMPQYHFDDAQVADIAAYLGTELVDPSFEKVGAGSPAARMGTYWPSESRRVEIGRRLFKELRCGNCHEFPGGSDWLPVGPDLARIAEKKDSELPWGGTSFPRTLADYVWHKVETPEAYETAPHQLKMPNYGFTSEEAEDVTIAVLSQADPWRPPHDYVVRSHRDDKLPVAGEFGRLVQRYRCTSCHSVNGVGNNVSCDLGTEGSRSRREWIYQYLKLPYTIRPLLTVRMPVFHLSDEDARVLADGISTYWRDPQIDALGDFPTSPSEVESGRVLFESRGCLSCHQVGDRGGFVGPSFTGGGPMARRFRIGWLVKWLEDARALKPDVLEPRFGFSRDQARAVAAYLMTVSPDPPAEAR